VLWIRKEWRNPEGRNKAGKKGTWRPSKLTTARSNLDRIGIVMMVVEMGREGKQKRGEVFAAYP
jgi:hypothetical protein